MSPTAGVRLRGMTKIYTGASMSLDGYISGPEESGFDLLFDWYNNGDVVVETAREDLTMRLTPPSAEYFRHVVDTAGALVVGRHAVRHHQRLGGPASDRRAGLRRHPRPADRLEAARAEPAVHVRHRGRRGRDRAGRGGGGLTKAVVVNGGTMARQALEAGLIDELWIDLVPLLLGSGTPMFDQVKTAPISLEGPFSVVEGKSVTHLRYRVKR